MVDSSDGVWIRDKIIDIERELGGMAERHRSLEQSDQLIRAEVRDGFARQERMFQTALEKIEREIMSNGAHGRGEINRVADLVVDMQKRFEEMRRNAEADMSDVRRQLEKHAEIVREEALRTKQNNRIALIVLGVLVVGMEKLLEVAPQIVDALT